MSTPTIDIEIRTYVAAVEAELADLEPEERSDLLEDLEQHLREVAAEDDGTLTERLGPPSAFAAELRASAGLASPSSGRSLRMRDRVNKILDRSQDIPGVRQMLEFMPELRPGWWVLRGYLLVVAIDVLFTTYSGDSFPLPSFQGSVFVGAVAVLVWIWASVMLGRASRVDQRARVASIVISAVTVVLALMSLGRIEQIRMTYIDATEYQQPTPVEYLHHADQSAITNICPYTTDLKPVAGVLLFDQKGRPIENIALPEGSEEVPAPTLQPAFPNAYPRAQKIFDGTRVPHDFACPTVGKAKKR